MSNETSAMNEMITILEATAVDKNASNKAMKKALIAFDEGFSTQPINIANYTAALIKSSEITRRASAKASLQSSVLDTLSYDNAPQVRIGVAQNENTGTLALRRLLNDSDSSVALWAELGLEDRA